MEIEKTLPLFLEFVSESENDLLSPVPPMKLLSVKHKIESSIWVRTQTAQSKSKCFVEKELVSSIDRRAIPMSKRVFKSKMDGGFWEKVKFWTWGKNWRTWLWMKG
jgi:hypothetical protein